MSVHVNPSLTLQLPEGWPQPVRNANECLGSHNWMCCTTKNSQYTALIHCIGVIGGVDFCPIHVR